MAEEELPDFYEQEDTAVTKKEDDGKEEGDKKKGGYAAIHASGFKDFLLKPNFYELSWIVVSSIHLRCNMSAFRRRSLAQTCFAKPSQAWGKQRCLCSPACNRSRPLGRTSKFW